MLVCYNQEPYIKEAVESIIVQEIPVDFEIVVADDCSTDRTTEIIEQTFSQHQRSYIRIDAKHNLGISKNYKRGFAACRGEYIAVIEGDDYWDDPMRLKKHIEFLDNNPNCVLSFNRIKIYYQDKDLLITQSWNHPDNVEFITPNMMARKNRIGNLSACVFRTSALQKLRPDIYDLGIADWMLGMALGEYGGLAKLKEPTSVYRVHDKGKWSGRSKKDKFSRLINTTIPKYDKFLDYQYHEEFEAYKKDILLKLKRDAIKNTIVKIIPAFLINGLQMITPAFIKALIKKFI